VPPNLRDVDVSGWLTDSQAQQLTEDLQNALGDDFDVINEATRPAGQTV